MQDIIKTMANFDSVTYVHSQRRSKYSLLSWWHAVVNHVDQESVASGEYLSAATETVLGTVNWEGMKERSEKLLASSEEEERSSALDDKCMLCKLVEDIQLGSNTDKDWHPD